MKWMVVNSCLSIITLNVNGLNAPTKRYKLAEWIQKQDPYICALQKINFTSTDWKWGGGKRLSMQMETKRKLDKQYSYQTK